MLIVDTKHIVRHSILTAMAMDTVGYALSGHSRDDRIKWCYGDKISYPKHKKDQSLNAKVSPNSRLFTIVLEGIANINPLEIEDIYETVGEIQKNVTSSKFFTRSLVSADGCLAIPVAAAVAYYTALAGLDRTFYLELIRNVFARFHVPSVVAKPSVMFGYVLAGLLVEGFFDLNWMLELKNEGLIPERMSSFMRRLMDGAMDAEFLRGVFDPGYVEKLNCVERVLAESLYLMTRVSTAYPKAVLNSTPRDQIVEVFTSEASDSADMGFVFGALCTASEHGHPLTTKQLREAVEMRPRITESLSYIS